MADRKPDTPAEDQPNPDNNALEYHARHNEPGYGLQQAIEGNDALVAPEDHGIDPDELAVAIDPDKAEERRKRDEAQATRTDADDKPKSHKPHKPKHNDSK
jgi:hypothetical protein